MKRVLENYVLSCTSNIWDSGVFGENLNDGVWDMVFDLQLNIERNIKGIFNKLMEKCYNDMFNSDDSINNS